MKIVKSMLQHINTILERQFQKQAEGRGLGTAVSTPLVHPHSTSRIAETRVHSCSRSGSQLPAMQVLEGNGFGSHAWVLATQVGGMSSQLLLQTHPLWVLGEWIRRWECILFVFLCVPLK